MAENRLLAALPSERYERLLPALETVTLGQGQVVSRPREPSVYVYFPRSALVSLVISMDDGPSAEVATIGREGMIGLPLILGAVSAPSRALCQIPGEAVRMPAHALLAELKSDPRALLRDLLLRYAQALFNQVLQVAACNRLHSLDGRCARWLLMTVDGTGTETIPLTQALLAQILGTRRAAISETAGGLRQAGAIRYSRGRLHIQDRARLEAAACECYRTMVAECDRLLASS